MHRAPDDPIHTNRGPDTDAGAAFSGATRSRRRAPIALVIAAAAVVGIALGTRPSPTGPADRDPAAEGDRVAASAASIVAPALGPGVQVASPVVPPPRDPAASPYPAIPAFGVAAGTTGLQSFGTTPVRLTVDLPTGWAHVGAGMLVKGGGRGPSGVSVSAWKVARVSVFPCRWSGRVFADRDLTTPDGLAEVLASWWGQDPDRLPYWNSPIAPLARGPVETAFLGLPAWRVDVLIPSTLDLAECDGGQLVLWEASDGTARVGFDPGELHRLWVVGAGREPIVIDGSSFPATSKGDLDGLQAILDSLEIAP